jgi:nucleotide-binding universal stress UspA family protein
MQSIPNLRHVLFPVDFSGQTNMAAPYVSALARRFDAKLTLLCVVPPIWAGRGPQPDYADDLEISTKARLEGAFVAETHGLQVERVVRSGEAAEQIISFARENAVDLIMMPTHGHGALLGALTGSIAAKVLHDAPCPVWTAAHAAESNPRKIPEKIICCVEGIRESVGQIRWAVQFAELVGAALELLHVTPPISDFAAIRAEGELQEQQRRAAEARIEALRAEAVPRAAADIRLTVLVGSIADTIAERASEEDADLLVIGHGRTGQTLGRLRTEAYSIIGQAACPVLCV